MNSEIIQLEINGVEFEALVEFDFHKVEQAITHLEPENCAEGSPDEYELNSLFILRSEGRNNFKHEASYLLYDEDLKENITQQLVDIQDAS